MPEVIIQLLANEIGRAAVLAGLLVVGALCALMVVRWRDSETGASSKVARIVRIVVLCMLLLVVLAGSYVVFGAGADGEQASRLDELYHNVFWTLLAMLVAYVFVTITQRALLADTTNISVRHRVRSNVKWIGLLLMVAAIVLIWMRGVKDVGMVIGLVGAGLALAFQESLLCIAGWVLIVATKPFDVGDRVQIDERIGDVIDIGLFQSSMLEVGNWVYAEQSTGRMLIVPNSCVFRSAIYNYTKGFPFIWNEVSTVVTFESDWKAARDLMAEIATEFADTVEQEVSERMSKMQARYAIRFGHLSPTVYTGIAENGVRLTLRYLTEVRKRRGTEQQISEGILEAFLKHPQIDLAYPTTRMFRNEREGKADLGGPERADA